MAVIALLPLIKAISQHYREKRELQKQAFNDQLRQREEQLRVQHQTNQKLEALAKELKHQNEITEMRMKALEERQATTDKRLVGLDDRVFLLEQKSFQKIYADDL